MIVLLGLLKRIRQEGGRDDVVCVVQGDGCYEGTIRAEMLAAVYPQQPTERLLGQPLPTVSLYTPWTKAARLLRRYHSGLQGLTKGLVWGTVARLAARFSLASVFVLATLLVMAQEAEAVRPFVTDDARIIDVGQIEAETWFETVYAGNEFNPAPAFNVMAGTTVSEWLEIIVGSGVGRDASNRLAIPNPLIQPKILFLRAEENGRPGFAMGAGTTFDTGRGDLHDPGMSAYLIGMTTWRRLHDWFQIHLNYGFRMDKARRGSMRIRPYWGLGFDIGVFNEDFRFIIESFAGDPLTFESPKYAGQFGFRWLASDYVNLDLTFGLEPELNKHRRATGSIETTAQLGIRLLFDAYIPRGRCGDPMGAQGMFPR